MKVITWSGLALSLAALCLGAGCSKGILHKRPKPGKIWTCDKEADKAALREDYETSILLHQAFLKREPGNGLAMYHIGYAYGRMGDHLKEVSCYEKAIALGFKTDHIFFNLGMVYGELNQTEKSIHAFKKAIKIDPRHLDARLNLGILYSEMGEFQKAREQLHKILEIDPAHIPAREILKAIE